MTGTQELVVGELLGARYRVDALLGRGGMASVYSAHDSVLGRRVAIKVFPSDLSESAESVRILDEMRMLAAINHPALVILHDGAPAQAGTQGPAYLVMELVDGEDLSTRISRGTLPRADAIAIASAVASALAHIHALGIVHRDVKPANILLFGATVPGQPVRAKLADLGIARLADGARRTATGAVLGTAAYLSPEQVRGEPAGPGSDIYSLGLVLLESLTGVRAYPGGAIEAATARIYRAPTIPVSLSAPVVQLIRAMTDADPERRPTASDLANALGALPTEEASAPTGPVSVDSGTVTLPMAVGVPIAEEAASAIVDDDDAATRTRVLPSVADTAVLPTATAPADYRVQPHHDEQARPPRPRRRYRRRWLISGGAAVLAAAAVAAVIFTRILAPMGGSLDEPAPPPSYAPVDGALGEHLVELQESVEP